MCFIAEDVFRSPTLSRWRAALRDRLSRSRRISNVRRNIAAPPPFPSSNGLRVSASMCVLSVRAVPRGCCRQPSSARLRCTFHNLVGTDRTLLGGQRKSCIAHCSDSGLPAAARRRTLEYESMSHNHWLPGSMMLMRFLVKFSAPNSHGVSRELSVLYAGAASHTEETADVTNSEHLFHGFLPNEDIDSVRNDEEVREPWNRRSDWIRARCGRNTCPRTNHGARLEISGAAASWDRCQWYYNNFSSCDVSGRGVTGTHCGWYLRQQALHAEMRGSFKKCRQRV